jgi:outer membrane protein TolC
MIMKTSKLMVTCAAVAGALALSCLDAAAQQTSEQRIQELIRQAAERAGVSQTPAAGQPATQPTPGSAANGLAVRLTLDDAVRLALERNLDIAVQRLNPEINDIAIAGIRSVYHPSLTSVFASQSQTTPSSSTIAGGVAAAPISNDTTIFNAGIAQSIPWGGGSFSVALNNNRSVTSSAIQLFNPAFNTNWSGSYTQPLLRGFRSDSTRQQLQVTQINRDISDVQLKALITNTVSNVRAAYWDYVFAVQSVEVARQSVDLANKLVQDNRTRVDVGTMAPIDVVQAQAQAASAVQTLVTAQASKRTAELALKRLIVSGTQDPNWSATLDPIDRPDFRPETIDIEAAVRRALSERTDLAIAHKNVDSNSVSLKYLKDQLLPQADLVALYGLTGLGGTQLIRTGTGIGGQGATILNTIPGSYGDALSSLTNNPRWSLTLNFSYPLGQSSQEAAVARARVQLNQVDAQIKQIELQVATDVTSAALNVQSNGERVQAAQAARQLAQQQLDAENSKFGVGMSTNYFVVQAQNQLATAQNNELQAILNYRKSLVELERVQQTTLQSANITTITAGVGGTTGAAAAAANTAAANTGGAGGFGR